MAEKLISFEIQEPLKANRWIVRIPKIHQEIPEYLFTDFKLETEIIKEGKKFKQALKLTLHCYNTVNFLLLPDDVINTTKVKIEFLDPVGSVVNHYDMTVELDKLTLLGDYGSGDLLRNEIVFWVKDLNPLHLNGNTEKEIFENYKKNN